jgi:hypothetical protein
MRDGTTRRVPTYGNIFSMIHFGCFIISSSSFSAVLFPLCHECLIAAEKRPEAVAAADTNLYEMGNMLKHWELELRSLPFNQKSKMQPQLKTFRNTYDAQKQDFAKAKVPSAKRQAFRQEVTSTLCCCFP